LGIRCAPFESSRQLSSAGSPSAQFGVVAARSTGTAAGESDQSEFKSRENSLALAAQLKNL
jgi:hypothetical protein